MTPYLRDFTLGSQPLLNKNAWAHPSIVICCSINATSPPVRNE